MTPAPCTAGGKNEIDDKIYDKNWKFSRFYTQTQDTIEKNPIEFQIFYMNFFNRILFLSVQSRDFQHSIAAAQNKPPRVGGKINLVLEIKNSQDSTLENKIRLKESR